MLTRQFRQSAVFPDRAQAKKRSALRAGSGAGRGISARLPFTRDRRCGAAGECAAPCRESGAAAMFPLLRFALSSPLGRSRPVWARLPQPGVQEGARGLPAWQEWSLETSLDAGSAWGRLPPTRAPFSHVRVARRRAVRRAFRVFPGRVRGGRSAPAVTRRRRHGCDGGSAAARGERRPSPRPRACCAGSTRHREGRSPSADWPPAPPAFPPAGRGS